MNGEGKGRGWGGQGDFCFAWNFFSLGLELWNRMLMGVMLHKALRSPR